MFSSKAFSCSCDFISPIEEFLISDYVFKGKVKEIISLDDGDEKVIFEIIEFYKGKKNRDNQRELVTFANFDYETSCAWSASVGQTWVVFANEYQYGRITFSGICSNSTNYERSNTMKVLENIEKFTIEDYFFRYNYQLFPKIDVKNIKTSIFEKFNKNSSARVVVFVDTNGKIVDIVSEKIFFDKVFRKKVVCDTIFGLIPKKYTFEKSKNQKEIEKTLIAAIKKQRQPKLVISKNKNKVNYYYYLKVYYCETNKEWLFED